MRWVDRKEEEEAVEGKERRCGYWGVDEEDLAETREEDEKERRTE